MDPKSLDLFGVLDLDDLNLDTRGSGNPFDHCDRAAALAASRAQNLDFHPDAFVLVSLTTPLSGDARALQDRLARVHRFDGTQHMHAPV